MDKRDIRELVPIVASYLSAAVYFGVPFESVDWRLKIIAAFVLGLSGIIYATRYSNIHGRNVILFIGASLCIVALIIEVIMAAVVYLWLYKGSAF